jgi:hypothetical protein
LSEILIPPQPLDLRPCVAVYDIAFFVLEIPWDDDEDVSFPDPDFLLYFSLDPSHTGYTVETADTDMVGPHHQFGASKDLAVSFLGQLYPDYLVSRGGAHRFFLCQDNLS